MKVKEKYYIFVMFNITLMVGKPATMCQAFFMPAFQYGGFVPPCGVLMHPQP